MGTPGSGHHCDPKRAQVDPGRRLLHRATLWRLVVANVLLGLTRRSIPTDHERSRALEQIDRLPYTVDHEMAVLAFGQLSQLATDRALSVYDASYLELAQRHRVPLACKDGPLRMAAQACGVEVL